MLSCAELCSLVDRVRPTDMELLTVEKPMGVTDTTGSRNPLSLAKSVDGASSNGDDVISCFSDVDEVSEISAKLLQMVGRKYSTENQPRSWNR